MSRNNSRKENCIVMLMIERDPRHHSLSDRCYVLEYCRVAMMGKAEKLIDDPSFPTGLSYLAEVVSRLLPCAYDTPSDLRPDHVPETDRHSAYLFLPRHELSPFRTPTGDGMIIAGTLEIGIFCIFLFALFALPWQGWPWNLLSGM